MSKAVKIAIVALVALVAYRWWKARQAGNVGALAPNRVTPLSHGPITTKIVATNPNSWILS